MSIRIPSLSISMRIMKNVRRRDVARVEGNSDNISNTEIARLGT